MTFFSRNTGLKLISLFLAFGLWYYALGEEGIEVTRTVPIEVVVANPQLSVLGMSTRTVDVTFVAPRGVLSELASADIKAVHTVDGNVKTAGEYSFRVEANMVQVNIPQVRIESIRPEAVMVTLDEMIVQKVSVVPDFSGEPAVGYKLITEEIEINPNAVMLEGPKSALEKLDAARTEKIDIVGRTRSFRRMVNLALPESVKAMSDDLIDVYIPIREELGEKTFTDVPVKIIRQVPSSGTVTLNPEKVTFSLKGSMTRLEKLLPENILVYVDLSGLAPGDHEVPVQIVLPEEVSLKEAPPVVLVHIS